jgi:protein tyrosine/serine phosphatase
MSGYPPEWVLPELLAKSSRPGYSERQDIGTDAVDEWVERVRGMGVRSIICFLSEDQLPFYSGLPTGLIQYYRDAGFNVAHIPEEDYRSPPLSEEKATLAAAAFENLEKPVLVHCSAGIARTGVAIEAILASRRIDLDP